jgi:hypothetical protein
MTFSQQREELANKVIADLCGIREYPDCLFPHTVFVEEESEETGDPVFNHYMLVSINRADASCILECPATQKREKYYLRAIEVSWLITVWSWCRDLMIEQGLLHGHAVECLRRHTGRHLDSIEEFVRNGWDVCLPDRDNIAAFIAQKRPERELEHPLRVLMDLAISELPRFKESMTYRLCADALEKRDSSPAPLIPYGHWAFLYPFEWFDKSASDDVILAAYLHEENRGLYHPVKRLTPAEFAEQVNSEDFQDQVYLVRMIEVTGQNQPRLKYHRLIKDDFLGHIEENELEELSDDEVRQIETLYNDLAMNAYREGVSSLNDPDAGCIIPELLTEAVSEILRNS